MTLSTVSICPVPPEGPPLITVSRLGPSLSLWISLSLQNVQIIFSSLWVFQKRKSNIYLNKKRLITFNQKSCTYQVQISSQVWARCTTQVHKNTPPFFPSHSYKGVRCWLLFPSMQPKTITQRLVSVAEVKHHTSILKFSLLTLILLFLKSRKNRPSRKCLAIYVLFSPSMGVGK